ncbi:MAG: biotin--[acetyl-CoA-carboxylase] ligase [Firmicutes bacterium]|nr:biotin--[acetyl-CoA-carboxylase] ligase [Bacillota bacterium]
MREKILKLLKQNKGRYLSGAEASRLLHVSRTAVCKAVESLRESGYVIASAPRRGYRLEAVPDLLLPTEIQDGLQTSILGKTIHYERRMESTNKKARELAEAGAAEGTLVVAEEQTTGRGRLGRFWNSPPGGIWLSLLLRPALSTSQITLLTLLAAVAAVEATISACKITPGIKWPNDLLYDNKKLAGILTEISAEADCVHYLIVGIGFNANITAEQFAPEISKTATSVLAATGAAINRAAWVKAFLASFETYYYPALRSDFTAVLERWRHYTVTLGQEVAVRFAGQVICGRAVDIDSQGALLLETDKGLVRCLAGDVTMKKQ